MVHEILIETLGQLVDEVTPSEPDPVTGRRRDYGVFRGVSNEADPLLTSLDRLGGVDPPHTKGYLEAHLLRNFLRYSRPHLGGVPSSEWELLVAAQHHGLPTRLLDWTYSPLVAAHFATDAVHPGVSCAVWRLDWRRVHRRFGLPELAFMIEELEDLFGDRGRFTPWALMDRSPDAPAFACMLEPPSLNDRIVAQFATFTLCSDTSRSFDAFLRDHELEDALTKYVIPESAARVIRDQLDLVGVDERRLFPDLDGVAAQMRRYYS